MGARRGCLVVGRWGSAAMVYACARSPRSISRSGRKCGLRSRFRSCKKWCGNVALRLPLTPSHLWTATFFRSALKRTVYARILSFCATRGQVGS